MVAVYEVARDRIFSSLEASTVPWRQTWQSLCPIEVSLEIISPRSVRLEGSDRRGLQRDVSDLPALAVDEVHFRSIVLAVRTATRISPGRRGSRSPVPAWRRI